MKYSLRGSGNHEMKDKGIQVHFEDSTLLKISTICKGTEASRRIPGKHHLAQTTITTILNAFLFI
jgi:hypothetical protein